MKVGIIGLGARIDNMLPYFFKEHPSFEVAAVADPFDHRLSRIPQKKTPTLYADADEMLAKEQFDMLMVGSPNSMHLDHLTAALRTKTPHIFAEKPVVMSLDETVEMTRQNTAHGGNERIFVGMVLRYSWLYRALKEAQESGQLGEIMSLEAAEHIAAYHGSFFMRDWRRDTSLSGGFMLEKCCHDLDLYQGIVGARASRVASFGGRKKFIPANRPATPPAYLERMSPRWNGIDDAFTGEGDLVDYQVATVEYQNGAAMAFHTNLNTPDEFRRFAVMGTRAMAEGDFIRNFFKVTDANTGELLIDRTSPAGGSNADHYGADAAMAKDIVSHLTGDLPVLPLTVTDAMDAGVTALAMDVARTQGRVVDLAETWARIDTAAEGVAA